MSDTNSDTSNTTQKPSSPSPYPSLPDNQMIKEATENNRLDHSAIAASEGKSED